MKIVADEGVDKPIVSTLRAAGFEVRYIAEEIPGAEDPAVLASAADRDCVLVTNDKDFGELVFRRQLSSAGIVLIRLQGLSSLSKGQIVADAFRTHGHEMRDAFTVISPGIVRIRRRQ